MRLTTVTGIAIAALGLVACGSSPVTGTARSTATPMPTRSPTPAPTPPLVVTTAGTGTGLQLSLVGEDGSVAATVDDPGGADGNAYFVGSDHVYFIDGTTVKAIGRDGTITDAGQVPQVSTTITAFDLQHFTSFAVSPDATTLVFGLPLAIAGDNGATSAHSQLWTEPLGGTAASATMVYDDANNVDNGGEVLMPFAWSNTGISVSERPKGLGGAGPFLNYSGFNPATFNPTTRALTSLQDCSVATAPAGVCVTQQDSSLKVVRSSGTETLTMQPANATSYGAVVVSGAGRYVAYGAYVGDFGSGHYVTTTVDLSTDATVSTLQGFAPKEWLCDNRLVVSEDDFQPGATWLLSTAFTSPTKISPNPAVGALG